MSSSLENSYPFKYDNTILIVQLYLCHHFCCSFISLCEQKKLFDGKTILLHAVFGALVERIDCYESMFRVLVSLLTIMKPCHKPLCQLSFFIWERGIWILHSKCFCICYFTLGFEFAYVCFANSKEVYVKSVRI